MTLMLWFEPWRRGIALVEAIGATRCGSACFLGLRLRRIQVVVGASRRSHASTADCRSRVAAVRNSPEPPAFRSCLPAGTERARESQLRLPLRNTAAFDLCGTQ